VLHPTKLGEMVHLNVKLMFVNPVPLHDRIELSDLADYSDTLQLACDLVMLKKNSMNV
jgi:hypothetical protein